MARAFLTILPELLRGAEVIDGSVSNQRLRGADEMAHPSLVVRVTESFDTADLQEAKARLERYPHWSTSSPIPAREAALVTLRGYPEIGLGKTLDLLDS